MEPNLTVKVPRGSTVEPNLTIKVPRGSTVEPNLRFTQTLHLSQLILCSGEYTETNIEALVQARPKLQSFSKELMSVLKSSGLGSLC